LDSRRKFKYTRAELAGAGIQTAGLAFGGNTGAVSAATEEYDGSTWTTGGNMNTARKYLAGAGIQTSALGFGGISTANTAATEQYDGATWSNTTSMSTARRRLGGDGTLQAALGFGGETTTQVANTEEFTSSINVTTAAAWASGGNIGTARRFLAGAGTQTAGLGFGGNSGATYVNNTEEYDGSTWAGGGNLGTARAYLAGCGTQTAGLGFGGYLKVVVIQTQQKNMMALLGQVVEI
jgi:hypothetical protein